MLVAFIPVAMSRVTKLTTNSLVSSMFRRVSFLRPLGPLLMLRASDGGLAPPAMKKLNGAKLATPFEPSVLTNAIGLGTTAPASKS